MNGSPNLYGRSTMPKALYALGDADNIRRRIEGMLLSDNLQALGEFSVAISTAIQTLGDHAKQALGADIIFCGGDDILFLVKPANFNQHKLKVLMKEFAERTGSTISFGVGNSAEEAFLNLARAKSAGSGTLIVDRALA
ncbi:MAG: mCpol domain-containing protein [Thermoanaerobaculia bacterium]